MGAPSGRVATNTTIAATSTAPTAPARTSRRRLDAVPSASIASIRRIASSGSSGRAAGARMIERTAASSQVPDTPFSSCAPTSSKSIADPRTRSRTVEVVSTSAAPACPITRAAMCTPMPPRCPPMFSTSPVWIPTRTSTPSSWTARTIASPAATARAGSGNVAR